MAERRGIDRGPLDLGPVNLARIAPEPLPLPAITLADVLAWPDRETIVLAELEPSITLSGFAVTDDDSHVYAVPWSEFEPCDTIRSGVYRPLIGVRENGTDLTKAASLAACISTAGTYFRDADNGRLCVHSSTGANPDSFDAYQAFVRFHVATKGIILNRGDDDDADTGVYYWPWLCGDAPVVSTGFGSDLFGVSASVSGSLVLANGHGLWHAVMAPAGDYNWKNKRVRIKLGGAARGQTVVPSAYETVATPKVEDAACDDVTAELTLQSSSRTLGVSVPVTPIFESDYPNLDPSVRGQSKPIGYGTTWLAPLLVDTVNEVYLVADAAFQKLKEVSQVHAVSKTDGSRTALSATTDYTVNLTACTITVVNGTYGHDDYTLVAEVTGKPDSSGVAITTFAGIVEDLLRTFLGATDDDLDADSFTQAAIDAPEELSFWCFSPRTIDSLLRSPDASQPSLERSALGIVRQNAEGKWQVKVRSAVGTNTTSALVKTDFASFSPEPKIESAFATVRVHYAYDRTTDTWQVAETPNKRAKYLLEVDDAVDIYTYLASASDALTLGQRFQILAGGARLQVSFEERSAKLFDALPGDIVSVSYHPAPGRGGMLANEPMELAAIEKRVAPTFGVRGVFRDVRALPGGYGCSWGDDSASANWGAATDTEKKVLGFWADDDGFIDPDDEATQNIKVWA
jgi:hypothetical protein